jgi:hypothetical protein
MSFKKVVYFFSVIVLSISSIGAFAQDAPPRGLNVIIYHVAPGQEMNFEAVSAKFKAAADKIGSPAYAGYSPGIGNDGQYAFVSPFDSFKIFADQQNVMAEVYEDAEMAEIGAMYQGAVRNEESYIIVPRPDLSVPPPEFESPPEVNLLISVTVKNGMGAEYAEFLGKLAEATKATSPETYYSVYQPGIGSGTVWRAAIPMDWEDLDTPGKPIAERLSEHFGARNGEKINDAGQAAVESVQYDVFRIRPDLSHNNQ